jgi:hypothetical protein
MFLDTPRPPEEPAGENPPDGAILDYYLKESVSLVTLEVLDGAEVIRKFSSDDPPERIDPDSLWHPTYWIRPEQKLSTAPGHHRFVWDLRYPPPPGTRRELAIAAVHRKTPTGPLGPFVRPSSYTIRLTADGSVSERTIDVRMDPRVDASEDDIRLQTEHSMTCYRSYLALQAIRDAIDDAGAVEPGRRDRWAAFRGQGLPGEPDTLYGSIREDPLEKETVVGLQEKLLHMLKLLQQADARPTLQARSAVAKLTERLKEIQLRWEKLQ